MADTSFLGGKVRKRSLPLFDKPPQAKTDGPKRLLLPQGELANFYDADEGIRYIALVELRVGCARGNHVHQVKEEHVYIISGEVRLVVQALNGQAPVSFNMEPGDLVTIATGVAHAIEPLTGGYAVEFSSARFDPADVQHVKLI